MNEKLLLDELRTIKLMCIANFIELQEVRQRLDIAQGESREEGYAYANATEAHIKALSQKLHRLQKDDLPRLWEHTVGTAED